LGRSVSHLERKHEQDVVVVPPTAVPEPGTLGLLAAGIAAAAAVRLIKRK
jgi:hypothetical protein